MSEVLRSQFEDELPRIIEIIKACDFISIDTEFTGLQTRDNDNPSLFDSPAERYVKLKRIAKQFTICQFGLSAFVKHPTENRYESRTYNFYLFPIACSTVDDNFACQASSVEFLCKHKLDFNKFIYEGIPYLNGDQERELRQQLHLQPILLSREHLDEYLLNKYTSAVAEWIPTAKEDEQLLLENKPDLQVGFTSLKVQAVLRRQFPEIWTSVNELGEIRIQKISNKSRNELEESSECLEERLLEKVIGFSKVFQAIVQAKKPVVGHNMLLDLCFIFEKLHRPLPATYLEFKEKVHRILPFIFDTKHLARKFKKVLSDRGLCESSNLEDLYTSLDSHRGRFCVLHSPDIGFAEAYDKYKQHGHPHEAGYDSFITGYVFLRMGHLLAVKDMGSKYCQPQHFTSYLHAFRNCENCVYIARATSDYVNFGGPDPVSNRPDWLHIRITDSNIQANSLQLAAIFGVYDSVDVRVLDKQCAILAVASYRGAKDILRAFQKHKSLKVAKYNVLQHSPTVRLLLWSGVAVSGLVCLWAFLPPCR
ncbi:poly(A)-specific ribonuclease PNLDC1-like [Ptychodera flava]|uniref:poly(A)-specific ribonuclease PNLDC1-like n=1 Tax=Ptychodera flava TaxID=63121 RepID=UPI00396AB0BC